MSPTATTSAARARPASFAVSSHPGSLYGSRGRTSGRTALESSWLTQAPRWWSVAMGQILIACVCRGLYFSATSSKSHDYIQPKGRAVNAMLMVLVVAGNAQKETVSWWADRPLPAGCGGRCCCFAARCARARILTRCGSVDSIVGEPGGGPTSTTTSLSRCVRACVRHSRSMWVGGSCCRT